MNLRRPAGPFGLGIPHSVRERGWISQSEFAVTIIEQHGDLLVLQRTAD
jgi:hypothetical protein